MDWRSTLLGDGGISTPIPIMRPDNLDGLDVYPLAAPPLTCGILLEESDKGPTPTYELDTSSIMNHLMNTMRGPDEHDETPTIQPNSHDQRRSRAGFAPSCNPTQELAAAHLRPLSSYASIITHHGKPDQAQRSVTKGNFGQTIKPPGPMRIDYPERLALSPELKHANSTDDEKHHSWRQQKVRLPTQRFSRLRSRLDASACYGHHHYRTLMQQRSIAIRDMKVGRRIEIAHRRRRRRRGDLVVGETEGEEGSRPESVEYDVPLNLERTRRLRKERFREWLRG